MKIANMRATLYVLISSIENDLRSFLTKYVLTKHKNGEYLTSETLREKVFNRFKKDFPTLDPSNHPEELLDYFDFLDAHQLLMSHRALLPPDLVEDLRQRQEEIIQLSPIRNRVMHGRPLIAGDYSRTYRFVFDVVQISKVQWISCQQTLRQLELDSSFVLKLTRSSCSWGESHVDHNLPMPDFDETGFVGRKTDSEDLFKLLVGPTPVVSLIGVGGVGKTALMLKTVYDIIDAGEDVCPFDAIIWVSAKTNVLTATGISSIRNAICDFAGLIENVAESMGPVKQSLTENITEIIEFMQIFKVMIVFDNLETVGKSEILDFIKEAQLYAKIAITSRIGLGELELRKQLTPMVEREAEFLLRELARIVNSEILYCQSSKKIREYLSQLHCNPLAIKWFVQAVNTGKSPAEVLNAKGPLLEYCLSNIYDKLNESSKNLISIILAGRGAKLTEAELILFSEISPLDLRISLNALLSTSLISQKLLSKNETEECTYQITPFAREYLVKECPPSKHIVEHVNSERRRLLAGFENANSLNQHNEFNVNALTIRNTSEKVVAHMLLAALTASARHDVKEAREKLSQARDTAPQYFEIYRVSGFIEATHDNLVAAEDDYNKALELEPDNLRLAYFFAGFLLRYMDDAALALQYAEKVFRSRGQNPAVVIQYARCLGYTGSLDDAIKCLLILRSEQPKMSSISNKISVTLIMEFYRRAAEECFKIQKDVKKAVGFLQQAIGVFRSLLTDIGVDMVMSKELAQVMKDYMGYLRKINDQAEHEYFGLCVENLRPFLIQSGIAGRFLDEYGIRMPDNSLVESQSQDSGDKLIGIVDEKYKDRLYAFIQCNDGQRYFFHKSAVQNETDWECIENGSCVSFVLTENEKGVLADKISFGNVHQ